MLDAIYQHTIAFLTFNSTPETLEVDKIICDLRIGNLMRE